MLAINDPSVLISRLAPESTKSQKSEYYGGYKQISRTMCQNNMPKAETHGAKINLPSHVHSPVRHLDWRWYEYACWTRRFDNNTAIQY